MSIYEFTEIHVATPANDCDIRIDLCTGDAIVVQVRPSNAGENYEGSLDIILPREMDVTCFEGDDLEPAKSPHPCMPHARFTKQLVMEIPSEKRLASNELEDNGG